MIAGESSPSSCLLNVFYRLLGLRVAQVRVIFRLPDDYLQALGVLPSSMGPLAYVEWFSRPTRPASSHKMYQITRSMQNGAVDAMIIELTQVRRSVQLFPLFPSVDVVKDPNAKKWWSSTVLELCRSFFISNWMDSHVYQIIY